MMRGRLPHVRQVNLAAMDSFLCVLLDVCSDTLRLGL